MRASVIRRAFRAPGLRDENGYIRRLALRSRDERNRIIDMAVNHAHAVRHAAGERRGEHKRA